MNRAAKSDSGSELHGSDVPRFSLRTLLAIMMIASVFFGAVAYFQNAIERRRAERERLAKLDRATELQIVKDVDAICLKLGRSPTDEKELESLLGHPMTVIHAYGREYPIRYYRLPNGSFKLEYLTESGNIRTFESSLPTAGWTEIPF